MSSTSEDSANDAEKEGEGEVDSGDEDLASLQPSQITKRLRQEASFVKSDVDTI